MPACVTYFQLHQPYRLRRFSSFDAGSQYFDSDRNAAILERVASKCYRPATELLLRLVRRYRGEFRVSLSISGVLIEQLQAHAPDVLEMIRELARSGCCELLAETYYHSLASLYSTREFAEQVEMHCACMERQFGATPRTFRNTELVYSDAIAQAVARMRDGAGRFRFDAILAEGVDRVLGGRSADQVFASGAANLKVLARNYRLSDDIAFRFSNRAWEEWPLSATKFASWVAESPGPVVGLFMDLETFGEHQWEESGIFDFLADLPERLLSRGIGLLTPAEAAARVPAREAFSSPRPISWADNERDLTAWAGNAMQQAALADLYDLEPLVRAAAGQEGAGGEGLIRDWRRLTTSDHFYYMCTKYFADGDVHKYFNPYESPYDAYINFGNVLDGVRARASASVGVDAVQAVHAPTPSRVE